MSARQTTTTTVTVTRVKVPKTSSFSGPRSSNRSRKRGGNPNRCSKCGRYL